MQAEFDSPGRSDWKNRLRIRDIAVTRRSVRLRQPFVTALRRVTEIQCVLVCATTYDERVGFGEAAATTAVTGETPSSIETAVRDLLAPRVLGRSLLAPEQLFDELESAVEGNGSAKAALDMAIHDLVAQRAGLPLYQFLGGYRSELETDVTVSVGVSEEMAKQAASLARSGFRVLKVKLGLGSIGEDFERAAAVRKAVGPGIVLRVDANQAWTVQEAIRLIQRMQDAGLAIELVEQPVAARDIEGLAKVTDAVETPIMADESVFDAAQAFEVLKRHAADMINIKLLKSGGIRRARAISDMAEACGVTCMVGSMMESRVSVTAAAHFAASQKNVTRIDLDAPLMLEDDGVKGAIGYDGPMIRLGAEPGLGISAVSVQPSDD
jgi:L-alanine-DL-glutamate epimerase-like enolase superfamily enzyme